MPQQNLALLVLHRSFYHKQELMSGQIKITPVMIPWRAHLKKRRMREQAEVSIHNITIIKY